MTSSTTSRSASSSNCHVTANGPKRPPRLRARQVLCNMCKAICTENGDKVERNPRRRPKRPLSKGHPDAVAAADQLCKVKKYSLVPKIRRLAPKDIKRLSATSTTSSTTSSEDLKSSKPPLKIKLTKVGKMAQESKENMYKAGPTPAVLKISFGSHLQTVMKIPPTGGGSGIVDNRGIKAARKAVKKAKKEAHQRAAVRSSPYQSPSFRFNSPLQRSPYYSPFRVATPSYSASFSGDEPHLSTTVTLKKVQDSPPECSTASTSSSIMTNGGDIISDHDLEEEQDQSVEGPPDISISGNKPLANLSPNHVPTNSNHG